MNTDTAILNRERKALQILLVVALLIASSALGAVFWLRWDSSINRGWDWGYFGDFNRVKYALLKIEGVQILDEYSNKDVTLEEFGFKVKTLKDGVVRIDISEEDGIRRLKGSQLADALNLRITRKAEQGAAANP
jgi:hypothetical protein